MNKIALHALLAAVAIAACASVCAADTLWDYQRVNSVGYGIHPMCWADETDPNSRITVRGVALAAHNEITNPDYNATTNPSPQYNVFVQDTDSIRGGIQAWAGMFYYTPSLWNTLRTTDYIDFQAGDLLEITGLLADMGRGKAVINNRGHSGALNLIWHVSVVGHPGLPDPELIPSVSNCNYFDQTRTDGGERYQTRYTMLHGVEITSGTWANNQQLTIADATGSVGMLLAKAGDCGSYSQPAGKLNVVGIFDQEDTTGTPYTDGYRIWVKRFTDIAAALDGCREVRVRSIGDRVALVNKVVSRTFYDADPATADYFYIQDPDRSGGVRIVGDRQFRPGDVVCVQGLVSTMDGENAIVPTYLSLSSTQPKPVFVTSATLWGQGTLDVNGLLVRVFAKVGTDQGNGTYSLTDDSGEKTIYAKTNGIAMPAQGTDVAITAIASNSGGTPLLLLAASSDIQIIGD